MNVSIVIPTFGRGVKLAATLDALLASETSGLEAVEIIVVDDGSPEPIARIVEARTARPPFTLTCLRQPNAGPAAARNRGFRASRGEIVLFVDDDILCPPSLIRQHVEAHQRAPRAVVFGRCPLVQPPRSTPLYRYLDARNDDPARDAVEDLRDTPLIASGQISFERDLFDEAEGIYRDDLATPAAEEFELSSRLQRRGVRILLAPRIVALHDHSIDIDNFCNQGYKYGKGCAEAFAKSPATADLPSLRLIIETNGPLRRGDSARLIAKKVVKAMLGAGLTRSRALLLVRAVERFAPWDAVLAPMYNSVIGLYYFAGVRAGLSQYSSTPLDPRGPRSAAGSEELRCPAR